MSSQHTLHSTQFIHASTMQHSTRQRLRRGLLAVLNHPYRGQLLLTCHDGTSFWTICGFMNRESISQCLGGLGFGWGGWWCPVIFWKGFREFIFLFLFSKYFFIFIFETSFLSGVFTSYLLFSVPWFLCLVIVLVLIRFVFVVCCCLL